MKKHLLIYGTENYKNSINSLIKSSNNFFDEHHILSPSNINQDFYNKNKNILDLKLGAGYFLWKPYIIYETLKKINDGDIIFYVDAGNIFINNPNFLYEKLEENNGIILFDNRDGMNNGESAQNFISCKKDSFILMGCDTDKYIFGKHLNASYQIYQKNDFSLLFVSDYKECPLIGQDYYIIPRTILTLPAVNFIAAVSTYVPFYQLGIQIC